MIGMNDSRESGEPLEFGPKAQKILTGFHITLTEPMKPQVKVRFEVDSYDLKRIMWDRYYRIICPRCGREHVDEKHHCWLWLEDHIHMSHGYELPPEHPLHRRTRTQKLIDWLESDCESIDL